MNKASKTDKLKTYAEFWPYYLAEYSKPMTRTLHYFGTALALALLVVALFSGPLWLLAMVPVAGYLFAWLAHFLIEKNRPATFTYPLWSLFSDFRMFFLWVGGRMAKEISRHKNRAHKKGSPPTRRADF